MKHLISSNHPDVIMVYQDRDSVDSPIEQIMKLGLKFKAVKFAPKKIHDIAQMEPKVLLLSSNDVKKTIQMYIDYLEEHGENTAPHSAILLINNRESACAYLACENGLFDNYVIINPFNEPFRLKLVLLKELEMIQTQMNHNLEQLVSEGEDELAACIQHGVTLKNSFLHEVNKFETGFLSAASSELDNEAAKKMLQNLVGISLEELNENVSANIEKILNQLLKLKSHSQAVKGSVEKHNKAKKKTVVGVNNKLLVEDGNGKEKSTSLSYKVIIAEPSDLFLQVIEEIFAETVFKYLLVNDGNEALSQIIDFKPDVVLMAYDLPNLNGIEITRELRKQGNKVPIIAYAHQNDKQMIKSWIPFGLSGYLIKPSKKSAILNCIAKAVKQPIEILYHKSHENKKLLKWLPEYSVGNQDIDEQHKTLFTLINDFFHQEEKEAALQTFQNLSSYIDLHFEAEENLLRQINYPNTAEHIDKHNELREKFILLERRLEQYESELHNKIAIFLYNWLATHILKEDMDYKSYAMSLDVRGFMQFDI